MKNDESIKLLAYYLKKLYINDSIDNIYNKIKLNINNINSKNISKLFMLNKNEEEVINNVIVSINKESKININDGNKLKKEINKKDNYVFEKMTYPLYLFIEKLYISLIRDKSLKVYFFAREGQFLKKLFDTYQQYIIGPKIESAYLYVSRASTFLGTLKDIKEEKFEGLFHQYPNMSLEVFCKNIAFNKEEINKIKKKLKLDFNKEIINIQKSLELKKLINDKDFIMIYDQKRINSKKLFIEYLSSFGDDYLKEMCVVDVGWKGSIQSNIQKILPNTKIKGYYLALVNYEEIENYESKEAVLFESTPYNKTYNCYLYNSDRSIFEILLDASHGSTINYEKKGKEVKPVLNNLEKELILYNEKIKPIQDNIFNKFIKLLEAFSIKDFEKNFNKKFFNLMFSPSKEEIQTYNSFYHFENFGIMCYSTFNDKIKISMKEKLKNYRHFRSFIQYDYHWQYIKLDNYGMNFGKFILYWYKWVAFKKQKAI